MPHTSFCILTVLGAWRRMLAMLSVSGERVSAGPPAPTDHQARPTTVPRQSGARRWWIGGLLVSILVAWSPHLQADDAPSALFLWPPFFETPAPSWWPQFL